MTLQVNHALQLLGIKFISNSGEDLPAIPSKIINTSAILQSICNVHKNIHQRNDLHYQVRRWRIFACDDVIKTHTFTFLLTCVVVGCLERKGISGGQRRRVSVAIEMMKEADMFLLDGMRLRLCDNIRWPICSQITSV